MCQFRDPVHGFIEVSKEELKIIDAQPFQRLRNIRQLGTTYLVFHGAEHTRFGHSIGVMHLASRVFDSVTEKVPKLFSEDAQENRCRTAWYRQLLRLIGLTHDLGHAPFSHASEELFPGGKQHEDYTRAILCETEIGEYICAIGKKFRERYGASYDITPELIWMIYEGKDTANKMFISPDFLFLKSFMDGELDCDKMDYLLRDALYCGVTYGKYDLDRFVSTLTAYKQGNRLQLAIERGGLQALEEFVLARYFMFIQVYFHKTRRYLDKALVRSLKAILPDGKYPDTVSEYLRWDDARILNLIAESQDAEVLAFKKRKIMTCVLESKAHAENAERMNTKMIFDCLEKEYGEGVVYDSVDKAAHKLTPMLFSPQDDSGRGILLLDEITGEVKNIMEESIILESIHKPISINRIYADKDIAGEVLRKLKEIQG